ncbi:hypothetical protein [Zobellella taiwanensis]|uniref:Uncharacterized protein n=1 Tax=Zobellella taiwanensis TaxID=347535 RepID=A0A2P7QIJ5_9GAMM|nr:hypothetical protein [Zobellella taiwanensis]PSJ37798.1 hypothetical protein C7I36_15190 [Zobellella taiwanensis]
MNVTSKQLVDVVTDVLCDVCGESTSLNGQHSAQFGMLQADWGFGSPHDGESYQVHLCEGCFFATLAYLKEQRRGNKMFSEKCVEQERKFGLIERSQEIL